MLRGTDLWRCCKLHTVGTWIAAQVSVIAVTRICIPVCGVTYPTLYLTNWSSSPHPHTVGIGRGMWISLILMILSSRGMRSWLAICINGTYFIPRNSRQAKTNLIHNASTYTVRAWLLLCISIPGSIASVNWFSSCVVRLLLLCASITIDHASAFALACQLNLVLVESADAC